MALPFLPWLNMGSAQAQPKPQPFPGRAGPEALSPGEDVGQGVDQWQPALGNFPQRDNLVGPPADLATAQASIEEQARTPSPADQLQAAGGGAPGQNVPRETSTTEVSETSSQTSGTPTISDLIANLNKRELESLKSQGLSVDKLKKRLTDMEMQDLPLDLTGLAQLTDAWTGSNFSGVYKPPETKKDRAAAVDRLQAQIMQSEQGMTESEVALLRSQLNSAFQVEGTNYKKEQDKIANQLARDKLNLERDKMKQDAGTVKDSEALKVIDRKFGEMYATDVLQGGFASAQNQLASLKDLQGKMTRGELGQISGPSIGAKPELLRKTVHPQAFAAQQAIEQAVQSSLKSTLGAQFTEREGQNILKRTFDPSLPPEENARRLSILNDNLTRVQEAKRNAFKHYEQYGGMRGYAGSQNVEGDFLSNFNKEVEAKKSGDRRSYLKELEAKAAGKGQ